MAGYCLIPRLADAFLAKLRSGEMTPESLNAMSSDERHAYFESFLGKDHAGAVNARFERTLLLKHQQQGLIKWAKDIGGLTPQAERDLVARVTRMTPILDPKAGDAFLGDLAAQRLGIGVTPEEAAKIVKLSQDVRTTQAAMANGGDRLAYGKARVAFGNYVGELKAQTPRKRSLSSVITQTGGTFKSMKASPDDSAIFRQGWKALWTHPVEWAHNAIQSFAHIGQSLGGEAVMDSVNADILSRPTYDLMKRAKLAVGAIEEAYPTSLPEKIPLFGRLYKASEAAFTGFVHTLRADIFDRYLQVAERNGVDMQDSRELESLGKLVNALTGRGHLGKLEGGADVVNNVLFSPRFFKSQLDVLTAHQFQTDVTPFVRKQAAINLLRIVTGTATVLAVSKLLQPDSVELDPRSSDFGKIKIGHTRFEVTGGIGSLATLAFRLARQSTKSTTTGQVDALNSGTFKSETGRGVVDDFFDRKLSPVASVINTLVVNGGIGFMGERATPLTLARDLAAPMPFANAVELARDPNGANWLVGVIADGLGIGTNTYGTDPDLEAFTKQHAAFTHQEAALNEQIKASGFKTYPEYAAAVKAGRADSAIEQARQALVTQWPAAVAQRLKAGQQTLSDLKQDLADVEHSTTMTPPQKTQETKAIQEAMKDVARRAMGQPGLTRTAFSARERGGGR